MRQASLRTVLHFILSYFPRVSAAFLLADHHPARYKHAIKGNIGSAAEAAGMRREQRTSTRNDTPSSACALCVRRQNRSPGAHDAPRQSPRQQLKAATDRLQAPNT
jgi:hypothetical protein